MELHLIKLSVGAESIKDLQAWLRQKQRDCKKRGEKPEHIHTTRMMPKRADELLDGGSMFWVIRGSIMCRERLLKLRPIVDKQGISRCQLVLDGKLVPVEPRPFRAFQGWRYLRPEDAPRDLANAAPGAAAMPEPLRRELQELGLL